MTGRMSLDDTKCLAVSGDGMSFVATCDGTSGSVCAHDGSVRGWLSYEGYSIPAAGAACGCSCDESVPGGEPEDGPDLPGVSVSFSSHAVIFEDAYTNLPGVVVGRQSTRTTLTCTAHGGPNGGSVTFTATGLRKLARVDGNVAGLPMGTVSIPAGEGVSYTLEYEGLSPSD